MSRAINLSGSFVNFKEEIFLTQRVCGIVRPFCYPIYEAADLAFQCKVNILGLGVVDFDETKISLIDANGDVYDTLLGVTHEEELIDEGIYQLHFNFNESELMNGWAIGDCYRLRVEIYIAPEEGEPFYENLGDSQCCFQRIPDTCFSAKMTYYNNENAMDFVYADNTWANSIRLPITFRNPNVLNDQDVYIRSDGTRKKLYAKLSKQYQGITDYITEEAHQKLVVALSHDNVTFVTDNDYLLTCTFENEYNPTYPDVMQGINVWPADFIVNETPFYEVNNNCA
jgi:hypothetical protein